jgi:hypothetical protein
MLTKKHLRKKWEVSIIKFDTQNGSRFKVTRRIPEMNVSETRKFASQINKFSLVHKLSMRNIAIVYEQQKFLYQKMMQKN